MLPVTTDHRRPLPFAKGCKSPLPKGAVELLAITHLFEKEPGANVRCNYGVMIENRSTEHVEITSTNPDTTGLPVDIPPGDKERIMLGVILLGTQTVRLVERKMTVGYEWESPYGTQKGEASARVILPEIISQSN